MVPVIAESRIIRIIGVTVFFLLADEGPFFVELDLAGLRGKKPRVHRGVREHGAQPTGCSGRRCPCSRRQVGWSCGRRSPRRYGRELCPLPSGSRTGEAFSLGKPGLAGLAIEHAALLGTVVSAHSEVAVAAFVVVQTIRILAAEECKVIHDKGWFHVV